MIEFTCSGSPHAGVGNNNIFQNVWNFFNGCFDWVSHLWAIGGGTRRCSGNPTWACHSARGQRLIDMMSVHGCWWGRFYSVQPLLPFFCGVNSGSSCQLMAVHSVSALQRAHDEGFDSRPQRARRSRALHYATSCECLSHVFITVAQQ